MFVPFQWRNQTYRVICWNKRDKNKSNIAMKIYFRAGLYRRLKRITISKRQWYSHGHTQSIKPTRNVSVSNRDVWEAINILNTSFLFPREATIKLLQSMSQPAKTTFDYLLKRSDGQVAAKSQPTANGNTEFQLCRMKICIVVLLIWY